jgi:hypothetical protein
MRTIPNGIIHKTYQKKVSQYRKYLSNMSETVIRNVNEITDAKSKFIRHHYSKLCIMLM